MLLCRVVFFKKILDFSLALWYYGYNVKVVSFRHLALLAEKNG